ncbi:hypothetical protein ACJRO7_018064 [Eucalyptus globulus]|uniref:MATH domain-containing protein n=1 Tax=Eucalyptus globulus TaxID=34317 RepID=A0ABD3KTE8_EUCGL
MSEPIMYKRALPPAHYSLKIEQFSLLANSSGDMYESGVFEAGGYKWSLTLYPHGDMANNGSGYISLYLSIKETNKLPPNWKVEVNYKLFVFDKNQDMYLIRQDADGTIRSFYEWNTQRGFPQFLSLETFEEPSNGYLMGDTCIFGAEVLVIKSTGKWESLTMIKVPPNKTFTWKIQNFSKLDKSSYHSDAITIGESKWKLNVYPKGKGASKGKSLSIFLGLIGVQHLPPYRKIYRECNLRVLDQLNDKHEEITSRMWVSALESGKGLNNFMSLEDVHKPLNGFLYNDVLIVEVQFQVVSAIKTGV